MSLFALQLAKAAGAYVVATTSSAAKAEKLRALGADAVLDYRRLSDWPQQVVELTGGGADHVIEVAGSLAQTLQAVAVDGELALVGGVDADAAAIPLEISSLRGRLATVRSIAVGSRAQFVALNRAVRAGRLEPVIDRIFPFDETVEALRYFARERPFGKVVITLP